MVKYGNQEMQGLVFLMYIVFFFKRKTAYDVGL